MLVVGRIDIVSRRHWRDRLHFNSSDAHSAIKRSTNHSRHEHFAHNVTSSTFNTVYLEALLSPSKTIPTTIIIDLNLLLPVAITVIRYFIRRMGKKKRKENSKRSFAMRAKGMKYVCLMPFAAPICLLITEAIGGGVNNRNHNRLDWCLRKMSAWFSVDVDGNTRWNRP